MDGNFLTGATGKPRVSLERSSQSHFRGRRLYLRTLAATPRIYGILALGPLVGFHCFNLEDGRYPLVVQWMDIRTEEARARTMAIMKDIKEMVG